MSGPDRLKGGRAGPVVSDNSRRGYNPRLMLSAARDDRTYGQQSHGSKTDAPDPSTPEALNQSGRSIQMTWSRPGPTPTRATGMPIQSLTNRM